jgi:DNA-binding response OmpR family regulator/HPt (histidine-containing phosphotransfer) domain-containing protein
MKVLIVEDDPVARAALAAAIGEHYGVEVAGDGKMGLEMAEAFQFDLILLDVMLPQLDGLTICQHLRAAHYDVPILLLTGKDSRTDRILGLDAGADDYLVKPCDMEELLARVRALLRRGKAIGSQLHWGALSVDPNSNQVFYGDRPIHLTPKEFSLLELMLQNPQRVFSRSVILDHLWDVAEAPGEETVSTHIKCLRQKLKAVGSLDPIETVYGLGYRLRMVVPSPNLTSPKTIVGASLGDSPDPSHEQNTADKLAASMAKIWETSKVQFLEQLRIIETISQELAQGQMTADRQAMAEREAHKLAGTLGMFGLMEGSVVARKLEHLWQLLPPEPLEIANLVQQLGFAMQMEPSMVTPNSPSISQPRLAIIDDDRVLAGRLRIEALAWGFQVEIATDLMTARHVIVTYRPEVILLDLNFPGPDDGISLLTEVMDLQPPIPVLAFTGRGNMADRLQVAKLGGCVFLHKPLPTHAILQAVKEALSQQDHANRILVVDDDPTVAAALTNLLEPVGLEVFGVPNLQEFWDTLDSIAPNLLILDLEMPGISGIDICQTIRNDLRWRHLPVLFFSVHDGARELDRAFGAGADDYICKTAPPAELVTRIRHRLQRAGWRYD